MHILIAILFILFGVVQYNDADYYIWMPVYFLVASIALGFHFQKNVKRVSQVTAILTGIWMLTYIPQVVSWINEGLPSITGSMKAESPFIEFIREFFGLLLCFVTSLFYSRKGRN